MIVPWKHNPRYGQEKSYERGMAWLEECLMVEDWGCALCYARKFRKGAYIGIDGTPGKADIIADLSTYRSNVQGVFMRGILEHNHDWRVILQNALASFSKRMSLMVYRPLQEREKVILTSPVEIDLPANEVFQAIVPYLRQMEIISPSAHGFETLFLLEKP